MCIGIPMQVELVQEGFAWVVDKGLRKRVETALIDTPKIGDWLLIFLDSAREHLTAERAHEIMQTHHLLAQVMSNIPLASNEADAGVDFALPSQMNVDEVSAMTSTK